jgi:hypothetical protein
LPRAKSNQSSISIFLRDGSPVLGSKVTPPRLLSVEKNKVKQGKNHARFIAKWASSRHIFNKISITNPINIRFKVFFLEQASIKQLFFYLISKKFLKL